MDSNTLNIKISTNGNRICFDSITSETAGCKPMFDQDTCSPDMASMEHYGSCPYADAHISSLKEQLKGAHAERRKAQQQLQKWTSNTALHPAFIGAWVRVKDQMELFITADSVCFEGWGEKPQVIKRLAPYAFTAKRDDNDGYALFTLLPSLDQLIKVNYNCSTGNNFSRMWVKRTDSLRGSPPAQG